MFWLGAALAPDAAGDPGPADDPGPALADEPELGLELGLVVGAVEVDGAGVLPDGVGAGELDEPVGAGVLLGRDAR